MPSDYSIMLKTIRDAQQMLASPEWSRTLEDINKAFQAIDADALKATEQAVQVLQHLPRTVERTNDILREFPETWSRLQPAVDTATRNATAALLALRDGALVFNNTREIDAPIAPLYDVLGQEALPDVTGVVVAPTRRQQPSLRVSPIGVLAITSYLIHAMLYLVSLSSDEIEIIAQTQNGQVLIAVWKLWFNTILPIALLSLTVRRDLCE